MGQFYLFIALIVFLSQSTVLNAEQLCNGYSELCGRSYADIAFPGTHNSFSYVPKVQLPSQNQFTPIDKQLEAGIRSLMLDGHKLFPDAKKPDDIFLCHTSCLLLNAGKAVKTLKTIANFLKDNPDEVITIIWENSDGFPATKYQKIYEDAGLDVLSYVQPAGKQQWPTLGELIAMNKRCISFIDREATDAVPWLLDQWTYMIDTPFEVTDPNNWPCVVDRPEGATLNSIALININHFLTVKVSTIGLPDPLNAEKTNGQNLKDHLTQCKTAFNRVPNFISVDFADKGDVTGAVAQLNGLTPKPNHKVKVKMTKTKRRRHL